MTKKTKLLERARDFLVDDTCRDCEREGLPLRQDLDAALSEIEAHEPHGKGVPTPEEFIRSSKIGRETKHIWGWSGYNIGLMVEELVRERDAARAEAEALRADLICSEDDFGHRCIRCDSEVGPRD